MTTLQHARVYSPFLCQPKALDPKNALHLLLQPLRPAKLAKIVHYHVVVVVVIVVAVARHWRTAELPRKFLDTLLLALAQLPDAAHLVAQPLQLLLVGIPARDQLLTRRGASRPLPGVSTATTTSSNSSGTGRGRPVHHHQLFDLAQWDAGSKRIGFGRERTHGGVI